MVAVGPTGASSRATGGTKASAKVFEVIMTDIPELERLFARVV